MSAFVPRFLDCRDMGHAWERAGETIREQDGAVVRFKRTLRCTRCTTLRKDEYRVSAGTIEKRRAGYNYPNGYQVRGGMSRGEARVLLFMPRSTMADAQLQRRATA